MKPLFLSMLIVCSLTCTSFAKRGDSPRHANRDIHPTKQSKKAAAARDQIARQQSKSKDEAVWREVISITEATLYPIVGDDPKQMTKQQADEAAASLLAKHEQTPRGTSRLYLYWLIQLEDPAYLHRKMHAATLGHPDIRRKMLYVEGVLKWTLPESVSQGNTGGRLSLVAVAAYVAHKCARTLAKKAVGKAVGDTAHAPGFPPHERRPIHNEREREIMRGEIRSRTS